MTLGGEQKDLVRSTWAMVAPIQEDAARLFYDRLFETDPSTRPLFASADMAEQGKKLMQTINVAVASLDKLETVLPAVEELGRRHAGYGVDDDHYGTVGAALLWTLGQGLGERFTPEVEEAWAVTYWTLANAMRNAAAREAPPSESPARAARGR